MEEKEKTAAQPDVSLQSLREENERLAGEIQELRERHASELLRLRTESALTQELLHQGARDPRTVLPLLQTEEIRLEEGRLTGLDKQIARIRQENGYLFQSAPGPRIDSGFSHERAPEKEGPVTLAGALSERYRPHADA
ncbi:MAG: hypothetical protein HFG26_06210 [Provencibacterium sp.]|jgi:hypothetical protein|nr:hypothetical protein [Provencibacterium sp.]